MQKFLYYSITLFSLMKFCPKCGGLMIPSKKDGKEILKCSKCGYEMTLSEKEKKEYSVKESKDRSSKVLTTSIVSDKEGRNLSEELEHEREEYYKEIGLELLREEFEGNEEEESRED
ncbi:DNA-directed RNA polymerase subunit M [Sulfolobus sp. E5-1-F]|uniref:RPA12/RPB9/RPC11 RNA polymerase family protein n=1 Tax=Sulfolobaceae TaxID=118883 RepID=UPI0012975C83|nr:MULTISPECIES: RPA12/RPB9/RPC11 RNA polymerase family protein [unclassified Sulfolobus]QGA54645.1 DNA-directed RNA polymerase subunit M [Sulfolobus sp. E5-1-F]QGA67500.1 DNA-directed RNA polymerase subunit M [Sulfolobus sp. E11-6]